MNRNNWKEDFIAELGYENDANDFFFEWITLDSKNYSSLKSLIESWLKYGKVRIKCFDGAVFFSQLKEDLETKGE